MERVKRASLAAAAVLALGGCDLDLNDPNLPTDEDALGTLQGLNLVAVGLQAEYGNTLQNPVYVTGLVADEIGAGGATFEIYQRLDRGVDPVDNNLDPAVAPWTGQYRVIRIANDLLREVPGAGFGPGTTSGMLALANLYKGMALGNLAQTYQRAPVLVGPGFEDPSFPSREELLAAVLATLVEARDQLVAQPPSAEFLDRIVAPGLSLANTIDAMIARYALIAGELSMAEQAALRVDLTVLSELRFSASDPNPLWNMWYNSGNAFQMRAKEGWRLAAEPGDQRVAYWVEEADIQGAVGPLDDVRRYQSSSASYPAYLPDEMRLIRAEVAARQGDIASALSLVNQVRTQCDSPLDEPVACLPARTAAQLPNQAAVLEEIYRQRRYELYLQGVAWSDLRRFGMPRKYEFMPVPQPECERNSSTPQELCVSG